jgi:hypothetical protein
MIGRRVAAVSDIELPGDYCGPVTGEAALGYEGENCFFLLPGSRHEDAQPELRSLCRVTFPPHVYRECSDGSLEIRESIALLDRDGNHAWHGYLDESHVWRTA